MRAVVFGAGGGIGAALVRGLAARGVNEIYAGARRLPHSLTSGATPFTFDLAVESSISGAFERIGGAVDLVIVATGILQSADLAIRPERSISQVDPVAMARTFAINAIGPALIAKHAVPLLPRHGRSVFAALSARVGSIGENRLGGWHSYRASKAALNMLVANLGIELARSHPGAIAVGLHPGTVDTALSEPFQRGLREGQLLSPDASARHLLDVIEGLAPAQSGHCIGWDGTIIPS